MCCGEYELVDQAEYLVDPVRAAVVVIGVHGDDQLEFRNHHYGLLAPAAGSICIEDLIIALKVAGPPLVTVAINLPVPCGRIVP